MRARVLEVLGHAVHARISMEALQAGLIADLQAGIEPFVFGATWTKQHLDVLAAAAASLNVCFHLLKWIQAPVHPSRLDDAIAEAQSLLALAASSRAMTQIDTKASMATKGLILSHSQAPTVSDRSRTG